MKDKIQVLIFIILLFSITLTIILTKDKEISKYERRKLLTSSSLKEDFIENIDEYLSDQFPLRDTLISLNSIYEREILNIIDSKNTYIYEDSIIERNFPLNETSLEDYIKKINFIIDNNFQNNKVYHSVILDKAYFLNGNYQKLDYNYLLNKVKKDIKGQYIDITGYLKLEDYYKTDIHIKQPSYLKIMSELSSHMNFKYKKYDYLVQSYDNFLGSSYSKAPTFKNYDTLEWLTNNYMNDVKVTHLEYKDNNIYETKELQSLDPYNIFLKGPSALIEIDNLKSDSSKELIIFRDSFASSLTPLLIPYYKKITLIDLRYINFDLLEYYIKIDNQDILFLYSTLIINNSSILKVNMNK